MNETAPPLPLELAEPRSASPYFDASLFSAGVLIANECTRGIITTGDQTILTITLEPKCVRIGMQK